MAQDPKTDFNHIDNLVFQGGGVKGVAYIGVLEELAKMGTPNFKRVAGTSAGALLALALALKLPIKDISQLLMIDFKTLLDDYTILPVCVNVNAFFGDSKILNFSARDIILNTLNMLSELREQNNMVTLLNDIVYHLLQYLLWRFKFGFVNKIGIPHTSISFVGSVAKFFTRWFLTVLAPNKLKDNQIGRRQNFMRFQPNTKESSTSEPQDFGEEIDDAVNDAITRIQNDQKNLQGSIIKKENMDYIKKTFDGSINDFPESDMKSMKKKRSAEQTVKLEDGSQLKGEVLHFAIAELIFHIAFKDPGTKPIGIFSGDLFITNLIEVALKKAFDEKKIPEKYNRNLTFKDLASFEDNDGKPLFLPLYVVAYNTGLLRTEVFSHEHTPNVSLIDAVHASMSIPIFFTPKKIRENGEVRKVYLSDDKPETAYYMDGGITDNLPMWIFDDLKYCIGENHLPNWNPERKIAIQNPYTLGFKLSESERINIYTNPFLDNEGMKQKKVYNSEFVNTMGYYVGSIVKTVGEQEESQFIHRNDCPRVVYVDNLGVSPVDFNLSDQSKEHLKQSGHDSVRTYIKRATKTRFIGEGEPYPPRFSKKFKK